MTPFAAHALAEPLRELASEGIFIGTSSWKYVGWLGNLYDEQRYLRRKRFSKAFFEAECLAEYASVFKAVGVDACYYQFPTATMLEEWGSKVPQDFRFCPKVTADITTKRFPKLDRYGAKGGQVNPLFLNAEVFEEKFLQPCASIRNNIGLLMLEFSHIDASAYKRGRDFVADLDAFLGKLPKGWQYGVEVRNKSLLAPEYFETLARHGIVHIYNQWEKMPSVAEQMALPGSRTADFVAARFLLKPGRKYEDAVKLFAPYQQVREPDAQAREAARQLIETARSDQKPSKPKSFLFFNNRIEGNALGTVRAVLQTAGLMAA